MSAISYSYSEDNFIHHVDALQPGQEHQLSEFDKLLLSQWDKAMEAGLFNYQLDKVNTKILPGKLQYVLQLNVKRGRQKRKGAFISSLQTPFDPNKFNFNKVPPQEIIVYLHPEHQDAGKVKKCPILINVSPLDYGHILLIPDVEDCLPQQLTPHTLEMGLNLMLLSAHRGLCVAFNSLCAMASVNHLHMHAWYCEYPIYTQHWPVKPVCGTLHRTEGLPVDAFVFQLHGTTVQHLVQCVYVVTKYLQEQEIAHNVMIIRGNTFQSSDVSTIRVYIWPRKSVVGAKNAEFIPFNVAVAELAGQVPYYEPDLFETMTEESISADIREHDLSEETFQDISTTLCANHKQLFEKSGIEGAQNGGVILQNGVESGS